MVDQKDGWVGLIVEGPTKDNHGESRALQAQFIVELLHNAIKLGLLRSAGLNPSDLTSSISYECFDFFSLEGAAR